MNAGAQSVSEMMMTISYSLCDTFENGINLLVIINILGWLSINWLAPQTCITCTKVVFPDPAMPRTIRHTGFFWAVSSGEEDSSVGRLGSAEGPSLFSIVPSSAPMMLLDEVAMLPVALSIAVKQM